MTLTCQPQTESRRRVRIHGWIVAAVTSLCFLLPPFSLQANAAADTITIAGGDGNRYGVTRDGGPAIPGNLPTNTNGTVFRLSPAGELTVLHVFSINDPANGWGPAAALIEGPDGNFYGTTAFGGAFCAECGTIFRITPQGVHSRLHSFNGTDGAAPSVALTVGSDGRLYGVTDGGATGVATLFSITTDGEFKLLRTEPDTGLATTQTLAEEMLATVQAFDPATFPDPGTNLIDDFDRPDSNTLGQNWTTLPASFGNPAIPSGIGGPAQILASHAVGGTNDSIGGNYWNTPFGPDQEVYGFFFFVDYDALGLHVRYDPVTGNGYAIDWDGGSLRLYRVVNNQFTSLGVAPGRPFVNNPDLEISPATWLGLRAAGNNITVWQSPDGTAWTKIIDVTDNQVQGGGHAGFHLYHTRQSFDDFHASSLDIPPPPPPPPPPPDDDDSDDGDDGGDGDNGGGSGNPDDEAPVTPIAGSPGGGRRGGIGLGAAGLEWLALLALGFLIRQNTGFRGRTTLSRRK